jgi:hypothetical protein
VVLGKHGARPGRHRISRLADLPAVPAVLGAVLVVVVVTTVVALHQPSAPAAPATTRPAAAAPRPTPVEDGEDVPAALHLGRVSVASAGFLAWALLDRGTGRITGSANFAAHSDTMSMIKAWLGADYLRGLDEVGEEPTPTRLALLTVMIRDSDNEAAETFYRLDGGNRAVERMIQICELTDSVADATRWSNTIVSARDTTRLGLCLADGRAAGTRWTPWLLNEMRHVRGDGDFGVRTALPPADEAQVAIKNGWLLRDEDDQWHIACLAIAERWVVAVLARYPGRLGFEHGTDLCRDVGVQLLGPEISLATPAATG